MNRCNTNHFQIDTWKSLSFEISQSPGSQPLKVVESDKHDYEMCGLNGGMNWINEAKH
jgi:hypothetical protein